MSEDQDFKKRRKILLKNLPAKSVVLIPAADMQLRNGDVHYPFRQDSAFYYYTGFCEPKSYLLLIKDKKNHEVIYLRPSNPTTELWDGKMLGLKKAPKALGVDEAISVDDFINDFLDRLKQDMTLFIDYIDHSNLLKKLLDHSKMKRIWSRNFPLQISDLRSYIANQRLYKDRLDLACMRESAAINTLAHKKVMSFCKPGLYEYELQALMNFIYQKKGALGEAYGSIVAGGNNANTLHYIENKAKLKKNELVLIDAGCEFEYYASDVTRTFPVSGSYSVEQKQIYQLVLTTQKTIIEMIKPGVTMAQLNDRAKKLLAKGVIELGILQGRVVEVVESEEFKQLYPHSLGHWLGIDVHDVGSYTNKKAKSLSLEKGMVLTIEPGLYLNKSLNFVPEHYRGIGVRIEDNILVTAKGHENLTQAIPKEIREIEKECQKEFSYRGI